MKTVGEVESLFEQKIGEALKELDILPSGFKHKVRFHGKAKDKKRTASFEKSWFPETDSINIWFERAKEATSLPSQAAVTSTVPLAPTSPPQSSPTAAEPLAELIRALDRAESRPGYDFVALKWFRDVALPSSGASWALADSMRQNLLRDAIDRRLILTSKVQNPKTPQFPVTAIRLNRLMPEVSMILGNGNEPVPGFRPIDIRGENLSATVLRERR